MYQERIKNISKTEFTTTTLYTTKHALEKINHNNTKLHIPT